MCKIILDNSVTSIFIVGGWFGYDLRMTCMAEVVEHAEIAPLGLEDCHLVYWHIQVLVLSNIGQSHILRQFNCSLRGEQMQMAAVRKTVGAGDKGK